MEASGPRTIVFAVSGTIELQERLRVSNGDLTIAGQTAPGDGITLKNYTFTISDNNVIVRYIRSRLGADKKGNMDAISGRFADSIIVDHCSFSWSIDEPERIKTVLYPNPASDFIFVRLDAPGRSYPYTYHITDLSGRRVSTGLITGETTRIMLDQIKPGMYILSVTNNEVYVETQKFYVR